MSRNILLYRYFFDVTSCWFSKKKLILTLSLHTAQNALSTDGFYFAYKHDLTHSAQRLQNTSNDFHEMPLYARADHRFVWNHHLLRMFAIQPELSAYTLPLMHGFISIKKCTVKQHIFNFVIISRRSCYRAGKVVSEMNFINLVTNFTNAGRN